MEAAKKIKTTFIVIAAVILMLPSAVFFAQGKAGVEFIAGKLALDNAPAVSFGTQTISMKTEVYKAENITDRVKITDARGSFSGWSLKANLSNFVTNNNEPGLLGSSIIIKPKLPETSNSLSKKPSYISANVELISGDKINHLLMGAKSGEGAGSWEMALTKDDISLRIPSGTVKAQSYKATISWTLSDDPSL